jgi:hypothetical protein
MMRVNKRTMPITKDVARIDAMAFRAMNQKKTGIGCWITMPNDDTESETSVTESWAQVMLV